jgi:small subunit ribosomal protein S3
VGQKVHPVGLRIGIVKGWQSKWYADKHYTEFFQEDLRIRKAIRSRYPWAGISSTEVDRQAKEVMVTIHTARPGVVIGRGGQQVEGLRHDLEKLLGRRMEVNIREIQQPELEACLVAENIAEQITRRVAYRRAMRRALPRTMEAGAKGIKITCSGRLGGAEIARRVTLRAGRVPLHTLRADIDYGFVEAPTPLGRIGVKVWIYKGDIFPQPKEEGGEVERDVATKASQIP